MSTYFLIGPTAPSSGVPSANYTVYVTAAPASPITFTPALAGMLGVFTPAVVQLSPTIFVANFTLRPISLAGVSGTVATTNDGGYTDPAALAVTLMPPIAAMQATLGDAIIPPRGQGVSTVPGSNAYMAHTIAHLTAPVATGTLRLKLSDNVTAVALTKTALLMDPGSLAADNSYTAILVFALSTTDTTTILAANSYRWSVSVTTTTGDVLETTIKNSWQGVSGGPLG